MSKIFRYFLDCQRKGVKVKTTKVEGLENEKKIAAAREAADQRLTQLETIIKRGLKSYMEVGEALDEIRTSQLYKRAGFRTFQKYCIEKWGFTASNAYDLIRAKNVGNSQQNAGLNIPPSVNVALALEEPRQFQR